MSFDIRDKGRPFNSTFKTVSEVFPVEIKYMMQCVMSSGGYLYPFTGDSYYFLDTKTKGTSEIKWYKGQTTLPAQDGLYGEWL